MVSVPYLGLFDLRQESHDCSFKKWITVEKNLMIFLQKQSLPPKTNGGLRLTPGVIPQEPSPLMYETISYWPGAPGVG